MGDRMKTLDRVTSSATLTRRGKLSLWVNGGSPFEFQLDKSLADNIDDDKLEALEEELALEVTKLIEEKVSALKNN
jgi:hypothetical protein